MTEGRLDIASPLLPIGAPPRGARPRSASTIPPPWAGECVRLLMPPGTDAWRTHRAWREHGSAPTHLANGRARWSDRLNRIEPPIVRAGTASRRHADRRARPQGHRHGRAACARSAPPTRRTSVGIAYMLAPRSGHDDRRTADLDPQVGVAGDQPLRRITTAPRRRRRSCAFPRCLSCARADGGPGNRVMQRDGEVLGARPAAHAPECA
jgi:hypothetical protein